MSRIEHQEWVGDWYREGVEGQRIAIVGFSHWIKEYPDRSDTTTYVLGKVCKDDSPVFFNQIAGYFGAASHASFWPRVVFFNYLPDAAGVEGDKFVYGTTEQHERARARFMRIIGEHRPNKVVIFSSKAWGSLPALREQHGDPHGRMLDIAPGLPASFAWGTYEVDGHAAAVFGLRHPQGASRQVMTEAVRAIMDKPTTW